ncbi:MAG: gliding motility lipoprotein GldH [Microscillaceae bacterium]|nr:gliding motility lipoprotein GldH [Microscillaceae bacterium]MDW8460940.1 gliding motility lipoprotein GldH [Cytophagales bacterium]
MFLLLVSYCLLSCNPNNLYEKNIEIRNAQWFADSAYTFSFNIQDVKAKYNIYYNIRNTLKYPYYNLYVTYYLENSQKQVIATELQNIFLMDAKTGEPFGEGLGDIFSHELLAIANYQFKQKGKYTFKIKQYMRQDPLPEILTIGIRVEKVQ